jgi:hypothetical protein
MPAPLLWILVLLFGLFAISCFLQKNILGYLGGILFLLVAAAGIGWFVWSMQIPFAVSRVSRHEIKTVVYPDGSKKQMYSIDGTHHCANTRWAQVIDENEYEVECVVPITTYRGVSYDGTSGQKYAVQYNLVKKEKK